ncbi:protein of unknown function DUF87 [Thermocrinis albus DSM 14484]|uniref:PLD phosphodiesterase domain-containing protein n=1 Tax=Thermocrinis albus (strain DSM 14484 / JCM 11386 / HI 11/12) TaxID=638303 RepID=D3SN42_THEAH|nr:DUF87 domain-containing protein [Thermocrinis albus]ADC90172.1 protein of unknown function DUF87 [Thermocrinis albus DSM 14484]
MEKSLADTLKERISKARNSVKIASAWIRGDILEDLLSVVCEGVSVEVIVRVSQKEDLDITDLRVFRAVRKCGGRIYINPKLHAKMVIVDDSWAVVGSANLTYSGVVGNIEAVVEVLQEEEIGRLADLFEEIKRSSTELYPDAVGVVISSEISTVRALLLEDLEEQSLVKLPTSDGFLVCRVSNISARGIDISLLERREWHKDWMISLVRAISQEKGDFMLAELKVLCHYRTVKGQREGQFGIPLRAVAVGTQVLPFAKKDEEIAEVFRINMSGYLMDVGVRVGKLYGTEVDVFMDLTKVVSMHMAVLGTTGSGKTTFVRRVIENIPHNYVQVIVMDLFGEYYQKLQIPRENIIHVKIPYTLFPIDAYDVKTMLRSYGVDIQERSSEERRFLAGVRKFLKPDLSLLGYREKSLEEILLLEAGGLQLSVMEFMEMAKRDLGEEALKNQRDVWRSLYEGIRSHAPVVVFDLSDLLHLDSRLNIVGLLLKELFLLSRENGKKRVVVLEEAHHFAPERSVSEPPAGRENLAFIMTKRIALEGRKLGIGLVAVTQRPANISKYILSQLNTQAVFRLITRNDLEAVSILLGEEGGDLLRLLPLLRPGTLYLNGLAVPFGMLLQIEL